MKKKIKHCFYLHTCASGLECGWDLLFEIKNYSIPCQVFYLIPVAPFSKVMSTFLPTDIWRICTSHELFRPSIFSGGPLWVINNHIQTYAHRNKMGSSMICIDQKGENMDLN